ncbi:sulfotransferase domain-containing protein [Marinibaculum pumilum]|uniref:Sulfotransferase domain-containing protein n=1 Tax=Marinibaculum pumilum TaxID=1766165 RepID=A0ABV7L3P7_9PROT
MSGAQQPSLFFVTLPKSGTTYTWQTLAELTGLETTPKTDESPGWTSYWSGREFGIDTLYSAGDFTSQMLRPQALSRFAPDGFLFGAHMLPSFHNVTALKDAGLAKVTVLLRDPRDATVSWVHHLRKMGAETRGYHSKIYGLPVDLWDWPHDRQMAFHVRTFLPLAVNWVEAWLEYYADPARELDIQLLLFDDLKTAPRRYFERILAFHGNTAQSWDPVKPPEPGKRHFRGGRHGDWAAEFQWDDRAFSDLLLADRLQRAYRRAAAAHPDMATARSLLDAGDPKGAARHWLGVLRDFPHARAAQDGVADFLQLPDGLGLEVDAIDPVAQLFQRPSSALDVLERQVTDKAA